MTVIIMATGLPHEIEAKCQPSSPWLQVTLKTVKGIVEKKKTSKNNGDKR